VAPRYKELFAVDLPTQTEAQKFSAATNDGEKIELLDQAHVIIIAPSGGGKTVVAAELARRGVWAANIPIELNGEMIQIVPAPLGSYIRARKPLVVGIKCSLEELTQNRCCTGKHIGSTRCTARMEAERSIIHAYYDKIGCLTIDRGTKNRGTGVRIVKSVDVLADEIQALLTSPTRQKGARKRGYMLSACCAQAGATHNIHHPSPQDGL